MDGKPNNIAVVDRRVEHLAVVVEEFSRVVELDGRHLLKGWIGVFEVGYFIGVCVKGVF